MSADGLTLYPETMVREPLSTDGLFVELHTLFGGERSDQQVKVPVWVRVDDVVVMTLVPEVGRAGLPTGEFGGTVLRLRRAGEVAVIEPPEEIFDKIQRALFPTLTPTQEANPA